MSARPQKGPTERRVSDDEIIGWVSPHAARSSQEAAWQDMQRIIEEHTAAIQEALNKLTLNA